MPDVEAPHAAGEVDEDVAVDIGEERAVRLCGDHREGDRERRRNAGREPCQYLTRARARNLGLQLNCPGRRHVLSVAQPLVVWIGAYFVFITRLRAVNALLLTGTVGSGKTTVLLELGRRLSERGEPHALVDLDWLAWVEASPTSELSVHDVLVANLAASVETFRRAGVTRLVLARHVTRAKEVASIEAALGGAELAVVRLDVPAAVLEARVRARDSGRELGEHLAELKAATRPEFTHVAVANDGRSITAVADEILGAIGW